MSQLARISGALRYLGCCLQSLGRKSGRTTSAAAGTGQRDKRYLCGERAAQQMSKSPSSVKNQPWHSGPGQLPLFSKTLARRDTSHLSISWQQPGRSSASDAVLAPPLSESGACPGARDGGPAPQDRTKSPDDAVLCISSCC